MELCCELVSRFLATPWSYEPIEQSEKCNIWGSTHMERKRPFVKNVKLLFVKNMVIDIAKKNEIAVGVFGLGNIGHLSAIFTIHRATMLTLSYKLRGSRSNSHRKSTDVLDATVSRYPSLQAAICATDVTDEFILSHENLLDVAIISTPTSERVSLIQKFAS